MAISATIDDLISQAKSAQISYRNLHSNALLEVDGGEIIRIPYMSLTNKYKDFLMNIVNEYEFEEDVCTKYKYNPKMLSQDLYDTTELWYAILEINNLYSILDFKINGKIKLFDPLKLPALLNEILILEGIIK